MKQTCESRARGIVKSFYFNPVNLHDSYNRCLAAAAPLSPSAVFSSSTTCSPSNVPCAPEFPSLFIGALQSEAVVDEPLEASESQLVLETMVKELNLHAPKELGEHGDALPSLSTEKLRKFRREVCSVEMLPNNYSASPSLQLLEDAGNTNQSNSSLYQFSEHSPEISSSASSGLGSIASSGLGFSASSGLGSSASSGLGSSASSGLGSSASSGLGSSASSGLGSCSSSGLGSCSSSGLGSSSVSRLESSDSYLEGDLSSARLSISSGFSDEAFSILPGLVREDSRVSLVTSSSKDILRDLEDQMMDA
ncbi:hypothetical protein FHG87_010338 [Trinorchestia longiramus]|nr:hypothetical protein FHG87_010338 [Trinorchestia longiramus]